jgi:aspartate kinase
MQVNKYGGTSVGSPERIRYIVEQLKGRKNIIEVLSAMSGTTDKLVQITKLLYEGLKKEASEECEALRDKTPAVLSGDL